MLASSFITKMKIIYERRHSIKINQSLLLKNSKWKNKNYIALGDSLTIIQNGLKTSYVDDVKKRLGFKKVINYGVNGQGIATMTNNINTEAIQNADLITVFCIANDVGGLYGQFGNLADKKDKKTFCGSVKYTIERIFEMNSNVKLAFITCHALGQDNPEWRPGFNNPNKLGFTQADYNNAVIEICKNYNVPVLDLFHNSGINEHNIDFLTFDKVHLNEIGFSIVTPQIISFVNNI